ncbi:MAG: Tm-1-like ATP-binding domain-containing protein [Desulfobacteraceae bacterium]|nr:Tm-1-like ATP-binding domain-containing protein [Desulfobacteraceae bacterium]
MTNTPTALIVATMDTKGQEAMFIVECLKAEGIPLKIMDAGIKGQCPTPVDVTREEVALAGGKSLQDVQNLGHEGKALEVMTNGAIQCAQELYRQNLIQGVIGLGGSMGTTLGSGVMRSFPVGFPKVMISTMASRDTRAFVGTKDILMLHSVCDLAGLNRVTRKILRNGALALAGMLRPAMPGDASEQRPLVFVSTLGTTEATAQQIRKILEEKNNEVVIFHTVGSGGKAMEEMIQQEDVSILVDLSLHEMADHRFGGDYDAGPKRGRVALDKGIPTILVPGNIDFLVTGPLENAQKQFPDRPYHCHNAAITVVRTNQEEIKIMGKTIAGLCNDAKGPVKILVPMNGFSAFDHKEGPLHDPEAPEIFLKGLKKNLHDKSCLEALPCYINDAEFAQAIINMSYRISPDIAETIAMK